MKKNKLTTSFLITIIMTLLLLVTLSTATFAWFSSNNTVDVSSFDFVAATRDGNGELMVGWDDYLNAWDGNKLTWEEFEQKYVDELGFITFDLPMKGEFSQVKPCMPNAAPTVGMPYWQFIESFYTAQTTLKYDEEKQEIREVYYRDGEPYTPPTTVRDDKGQDWASREIIYLYNMNPSFDMEVTIHHSYSGNLHQKLRVAVFVGGSLVGILSHNDRIYYGEIKEDAYVDENVYFVNRSLTYDSQHPDVNPDELPEPDPNYSSVTDVTRSKFSFIVKHHNVVSVRLLCWFDGFSMVNEDERQSGGLTQIFFQGEYIETLDNQTQTN